MNRYFADLHIHIGMSEDGHWVKMATSRRLTLRNILEEALKRKGIDIVGVIDAASPRVLRDIARLQAEGHLTPLAGGGLRFDERITLLLGAEVETVEANGRTAHVLAFFPDLETVTAFSDRMSSYIKNITLSSQNCHMSMAALAQIVFDMDGLLIPAHVFTPHKGVYGVCTDRLAHIMPERLLQRIAAVELGLSADTDMADRIRELHRFVFLSNSDAHSPEKIAREYNTLVAPEASYHGVLQALLGQGGAYVAGNYGLDPRLGKYHRTFCAACGRIATDALGVEHCPYCGSTKIVRGVMERIMSLADCLPDAHPKFRPSYIYQIPLPLFPGIGPKTYTRLLDACGTEMHILHHASVSEMAAVVGAKIAGAIDNMRRNRATIVAGGGGVYGKVIVDKTGIGSMSPT